ncbi:MAG: tetratricopeptide repeat protein, partial [Acidobacteriota bacterium]|nr:tetratricopeptide repeat protein [Acidobacteriota bacterium]
GSGAEEQKRSAELASLASEAKSFTANLLGSAPDAPLRLVAVKRGGGFSSGGTIFVDDSVFRRGKIDSQTGMNIAEAVAKIWLGNSTAVSGDGYGVIGEGLTKYIATQFIESKYGKDVADVERLRQRTAYAAVAKRDSPLNIVSPLDDYYYPEVANKGAMIWRLLVKRIGQDEFFSIIRAGLQDGRVSLAELRAAFSTEKEFLDHMLDQITETNLLAGLPKLNGGETKIALRNDGGVDATVNVSAVLANGEKMSAPTTIRAKSFGELIFRTANKITRVEVDPEKFYPQTDYSDDVAPRELTDSDMLLAVKRAFDKQEYANAELTARTVLRQFPRFDDVRVLLARSLLAQGKIAEAEKEFRAVLEEKLPTSRSMAWANVGLGEIASKSNQSAQAAKFAEAAIMADAEYGASLAARALRNRSNTASTADESVKAYFAQFDKAASANRKAELDSMAVPGEVTKFVGGISGQTVEWKTQVIHVDKIDANNVLVETLLSIKLLNRNVETGTAVFRLTRAGSGWKLSAVDIFEVR